MRRKAYVTGTAALLAAALGTALGGCSGSSAPGAPADDSKPQGTAASPAPAPSGKYRTLPEACTQVDQKTLDAMLPGIGTISDRHQREQAYEGTATLTYETDRRTGCRWTGESPYATDQLLIDFERVVSYDDGVSDDTEAQAVYAAKRSDAGLKPADGEDDTDGEDGQEGAPDAEAGADVGSGEGLSPDAGTTSGTDGSGGSGSAAGGGYLCRASGAASGTGDTGDTDSDDKNGSGDSGTPDGLQSRTLDGLGDAAFLHDTCTTPSSATRHRTVTVVFRTSNVIVTIRYEEQPSRPTDVPDSKKMQDTAQELAHTLAGSLND